MRKIIPRFLIAVGSAIIILLCSASGWPVPIGTAYAQEDINAWHTFDKLDGFQGSWVFAEAQTLDRSIWFATDAGIERFDGDWHTSDTTPGLPEGAVRDLLPDSAGHLWAATAQGVALLTPEGWQIEPGVWGGAISALAEAPDGTLWAGGSGGIFIRPPATTTWQPAPNWPLPEGAGAIKTMTVDVEGSLWIIAEEKAAAGSLLRWRDGAWAEIVLSLNSPSPNPAQAPAAKTPVISVLATDPDAGIWIGTDGMGIARYRETPAILGNDDPSLDDTTSAAPLTWVSLPAAWRATSILCLEVDAGGEVWAGTNGGGVVHFDGAAWRHLTTADGLVTDYISAIMDDSDGVIWFGTPSGISRYDPLTWRVWTTSDGAASPSAAATPDAPVYAIQFDERQRLWAGTQGAGLYMLDGTEWSPAPNNDSLPRFIESLLIDRDGNLWIGASRGGVVRYHEGVIDPFADAGSAPIHAIAQTLDGVLWFGSDGQGLSRWDGQTWQTLTTSDGLIDNNIRTLYVDSKGRLWVGTPNGVSRYEQRPNAPGIWQSYRPQDGLGAFDVRSISEAADGSIWFARWGVGASRLLGEEWTSVGTADGLLTYGVHAIWADYVGITDRLWFGTVAGLSVFDGRTWERYGVASGINAGQIYTVMPGPNGVFLGTDAGLVLFSPDETAPGIKSMIFNGTLAPAPAASANATGANATATATTTPEEPLFITVNAVDLLTPTDELVYRYRLAGFEDVWQTSRRNQITYPPLPVGTYRLEVIARDSSLNYSTPAQLEVKVQIEPVSILVPGIGRVLARYVLIGVAFITILFMVSAFAVWSTLTQRAMRRQAVKLRFNPYVAGAPIRDREMFYGREELLTDIDTTIRTNSLLIYGERRIGKTSLLHQIRLRLEQRSAAQGSDANLRFIPVLIDLEGTPESEFFHRLMEGVIETVASISPEIQTRITAELSYFGPEEDREYGDRDFRRDLRTIINLLQNHYQRPVRLIFLLDEADILNTYDALTQQQLRRIMQDVFAEQVGAVLVGVNISKSWDRVESPWYNMFIEMHLQPFTLAEAERLMREPVARFYTWEADAIHYVYEHSGGRPHRIQQIALEAVNHMLDDSRKKITLPDVKKGYEDLLLVDSTL